MYVDTREELTGGSDTGGADVWSRVFEGFMTVTASVLWLGGGGQGSEIPTQISLFGLVWAADHGSYIGTLS